VYDLLGFQRVVWLHDAPGVERAPRGSWPSDDAVVRAVLEASRGRRPFFVFAFPSSTHSPYNFGTYKHSDLDLVDPPSGDGAGEVKEYINALRVADRAIGALVQHFRGERDSTIIAVLGDHLPPLSERALRTFSASLSAMPKGEQARRDRRVPLLVWANFGLPHEQPELSTNALPAYLLEKMGMPPSGLFAVSAAVRRRLPVLSVYAQGADGTIWSPDSLPPAERTLVQDYRLLQYDLLLGEQYAGRTGNAGSPPSAGAATSDSGSSAP